MHRNTLPPQNQAAQTRPTKNQAHHARFERKLLTTQNFSSRFSSMLLLWKCPSSTTPRAPRALWLPIEISLSSFPRNRFQELPKRRDKGASGPFATEAIQPDHEADPVQR